jgi:hypothetical protein
MKEPWSERRQQAWDRLVAQAQHRRRLYGMLFGFLAVAVLVNLAFLLMHLGEGRWSLAARNGVVLLFVTWLTREGLDVVRGDPRPPRYRRRS